MARNTGHGYRHGAVTGRTQVKTPSGYVKRDSGTGRFMDVKSDNKPFKGGPRRSDASSTAMSALGCAMAAAQGAHASGAVPHARARCPLRATRPPQSPNLVHCQAGVEGLLHALVGVVGVLPVHDAPEFKVVAAAQVVLNAEVPPERQTPWLRKAQLLAQLGLRPVILAL